jgi:regulator of RNase E activity RraA
MATSISLETLQNYTACDISDALLKLKVPHAGFIPDLIAYVPPPNRLLIGPVSTALFVAKDTSADANLPSSNIPAGAHWVDLIPAGTILLQSQPRGQRNAVLGGIMAARLHHLDVLAVITHGRIRDVRELKDIGLPVFALGTSTVGQGLSSKCQALNVPITISDVTVSPGDIVVADAENGVVVIPRDRLAEVLELLPKSAAADEKVMEAVKGGMAVSEAFATFR